MEHELLERYIAKFVIQTINSIDDIWYYLISNEGIEWKYLLSLQLNNLVLA